ETPAEARRAEAALDADTRADVQRALAWFGHYDLAVDGAFGPGTRRAMADWQATRGVSPNGVLDSAQRAALLSAWREARAAFGFASWRSDTAGIEITLPLGLVVEDAVTPPFLRFAPRAEGGPEVFLISLAGTRATLAAVPDLIPMMAAVPPTAARSLDADAFTLTGADGARRVYAHATHRDGRIKGFLALWSEDQDMGRAIEVMRDSLRDLGGALPDAPVPLGAALDGLEVRRPIRSASGVFVDAAGRVLTSTDVVEGCAALRIDQHHAARLVLADAALGVALLAPERPLAPAGHARFAPRPPEIASEVVLAGYALPEMTAPVLTLGRVAALEGLSGEADLRRLSLAAEPGEVGGPVFDRSGAVLGLLLAPRAPEGRILPDTVAFVAGSDAILRTLGDADVHADAANVHDGADGTGVLDLPALTRHARALTVQVACWD
ncbi:serine protease, partial [Rhodobaculum claviforme]